MFQPPRDGSAWLCLNWSGCCFSFGNEFGSLDCTSSSECNRKKTMSAIVCSTNFVWATQLLMPIETFAAFLGRMDLVNALADIGSKNSGLEILQRRKGICSTERSCCRYGGIRKALSAGNFFQNVKQLTASPMLDKWRTFAVQYDD